MGFKLIWFIAILIQYDKAHTASRRYKVRGYTEIGQNSTDRWPIFEERPCTGVDEIISSFVPTLTDGYKIIIKKELPPKTVIKVKFDSEAYVTFEVSTYFLLSSGWNYEYMYLTLCHTFLKP